ncbi:hypothetical protein [Pseudarthrobacter sp. ATCC 49987]|uniref:hypothetical protein n=1 Tax=Pseudarthrobacter sp. ATCC 49987 TaxID=2698204 RepID=UPI0013692E39|nr:hypothetical protein [Pseudarthrobacter sp. ATCC 49987]
MRRGENARAELRTGVPTRYQTVLTGVGFVAVIVLSVTGQPWLGLVIALVFVPVLRMNARIRLEEPACPCG